jgi:GntR family transcriptional regulator
VRRDEGGGTLRPQEVDLEGVAIDRDAEVPIGLQLAWSLRARIADGSLRAGQRLPGLRELAEELRINVNTVAAVYQRLEREGLIDSRQGIGTFVARAPRRSGPLEDIVAQAAREARARGLSPREVATALYMTPTEPSSTSQGADPELDRRRALRSQIAALERAVAEIEADHPGVVPRPGERRESVGPALLGAGELEQVRRALVRRLAAVQAAVDAAEEKPNTDDVRGRKRVRVSAGTRQAKVARARQSSAGEAAPEATPGTPTPPKRASRPPRVNRPATAEG